MPMVVHVFAPAGERSNFTSRSPLPPESVAEAVRPMIPLSVEPGLTRVTAGALASTLTIEPVL